MVNSLAQAHYEALSVDDGEGFTSSDSAYYLDLLWRARRDSNSRPLGPQPSVLSN